MQQVELSQLFYKQAVAGLTDKVLNDTDLWYDYVVNLPMPEQVAYSVTLFHNQVFNGGLHQYFFNSYGQFAYLTIHHLKLIEAYEAVGILEKAVEKVNVESDPEPNYRSKIFHRELTIISEFDDQLSDFLNGLDNRYYKLDNLHELLDSYLRAYV